MLIFLAIIINGCMEKQNQSLQNDSEEVKMLKEKIAKFVPVNIQYEENLLSERENVVLEKLYRASKMMDELFLEQVYSKNSPIKADLMADKSDEAKIKLELFKGTSKNQV